MASQLLQHAVSTLAPTLTGAFLLRGAAIGAAFGGSGTSLISRTANVVMGGRPYSSVGEAGKVVELTTDEDVMKAVNQTEGGGAAIFDFTAVWCGPCKAIAPTFEALAMDNQDVMFYKVDVDNEACRQTVTSAGVSSVPMFIMIRDGEVMDRLSGADPGYLEKMIKAQPPKL